MPSVLVLSVPHNGTHFTVWFLTQVLGLDVRFQHFHPNAYNLVTKSLSKLDKNVPIVVPSRSPSDVVTSWNKRGLSSAELDACYANKSFIGTLFPDHNWVPFLVNRTTPDSQFWNLYDLVRALNLDPADYQLIKYWAYNWPQIGHPEFPDMHKYTLDEGDEFVVDIPPAPAPLREFTLDQWVIECHARSVSNGWWHPEDKDDANVMATKIALIHSELSEMLEGLRKGTQDEHLPNRSAEEVEAADVFIRLMDYCGARNIDLLAATIEKLAYNETRADHKPDARGAAGGKKF